VFHWPVNASRKETRLIFPILNIPGKIGRQIRVANNGNLVAHEREREREKERSNSHEGS